MRRIVKCACLTALMFSAGPSGATVLSLAPSKDNTLFQEPNGALSNGAGEHFFIGYTSTGLRRRGLLNFDVAGALPGGALVNSASLTLTITQTHGTTPSVKLHRALADWGEGTSDAGIPGGAGASATAGDATWVHRFYADSTWNTQGGDYASGTISSSAAPPSFGEFVLPSTSQLVADVQGWFNTPSNNFGWFVIGNEVTLGAAMRFASREYQTPQDQPRLRIEYTPYTSVWMGNQEEYHDPGHWSGGIVPNGPGAIADLGNTITGEQSILLSTPATLGDLLLNSESGAYNLVGQGTLNINGGEVDLGRIQVLVGSHTISTNTMIATSSIIDVSALNTITFNAPLITLPGTTLSKTGAGAAHLLHVRGDALSIDEGVAQVLSGGTDGTSSVKSIAIAGDTDAWTATLDLTDHAMLIDYEEGNTPLLTVMNQIRSGHNGGAWNGTGISSSLADSATRALGYGENSIIGLEELDAQSADESTLLIKYTFYGDANLDGTVDIKDLLALALHYDTSDEVWTSGDFNYDGSVDVTDLTLLAGNWQAGVELSAALRSVGLAGGSVPEPAFGGGIAMLGVLIGRRRRRME